MEIESKLVNGIVLVIEPKIDCVDASNVKQFREKLYDLIEMKKDIVCDLQHVQFVDSSGLGVLISCQKRQRSIGGSFRLCGLTQTVQTLFDLMRMERVFEIFSRRQDALSQFSIKTSI